MGNIIVLSNGFQNRIFACELLLATEEKCQKRVQRVWRTDWVINQNRCGLISSSAHSPIATQERLEKHTPASRFFLHFTLFLLRHHSYVSILATPYVAMQSTPPPTSLPDATPDFTPCDLILLFYPSLDDAR
ncbi:hypothetical protein V6N13_146744 [Hibiscus sabdariffa]